MSINYNLGMKTKELVERLKTILCIDNFVSADISLNGLQVGDLEADIKKVAFAVDASLETIKEAARQKADMLFVHHGLFWGRPMAITGRHYDRVKTLLDSNVALFACHLPLDSHPELGNNAQMAIKLGLTDVLPFSTYRGVKVGCKGLLPDPMTAEEIIKRLEIRTNPTNFMVNCENRTFKSIGIVSGSGASDIYQAMDEGLDLLLSGESQYSVVNDCLEANMSMLCLGHYETETFGVKAVKKLLETEFGLETCFIDMPLGL